MMRRGRLLFIILSLAVVAVMVGGSLLAATARRDGADSPYKYLSMFVEVLDLVKRAYVDETETSVLMEGALEGATDALGPFSFYVPANALEGFEQARTVGASRSGLIVLKERGVAFVAGVVRGSPAAQAGIERGDLIATLQGRPTRKMLLWEIQSILASEPGTEIKLHRIRLGEQQDVRFALATYPRPGVRLDTVRGVAVLDLEVFDAATAHDLALTLRSLEATADPAPLVSVRDTLILDLRNLVGGDPAAGYEVAGLFASGDLGVLKAGEQTLETFTAKTPPRWTGEVVVLVNGGTQGAAEILASVLAAQPNVHVVGQPSFGHSGRESLVPLSNGDRLQVTTAFFTGPDLQPLDQRLEPDVVVRPQGFDLDGDADRDDILEHAVGLVLGDEAWPETPEARKAA